MYYIFLFLQIFAIQEKLWNIVCNMADIIVYGSIVQDLIRQVQKLKKISERMKYKIRFCSTEAELW